MQKKKKSMWIIIDLKIKTTWSHYFLLLVLFFPYTIGKIKYLITLYGAKVRGNTNFHSLLVESSPYPVLSMYSGTQCPQNFIFAWGIFLNCGSLFWPPEDQTTELTPTPLFVSHTPMLPEQPSANDSGEMQLPHLCLGKSRSKYSAPFLIISKWD